MAAVALRVSGGQPRLLLRAPPAVGDPYRILWTRNPRVDTLEDGIRSSRGLFP